MTSDIQEPAFEAFMLAYHEYGGTGLGFRKCLAAYEAAKITMTGEIIEKLEAANEKYWQVEALVWAKRAGALHQCVNFFASVIKSGEPWTETCQLEYNKAISDNETETQEASK